MAQVNPCPRIYYEEPYNETIPAPVGCPPNAAGGRVLLEVEPVPIRPTVQPSPEEAQAPIATVMPVDGRVDVKLVNTTNTAVSYQVVGDTSQRVVSGRSEVTLQNLETPVTITFNRQDGGLLMVRPQSTSNSALLEILFDETEALDSSAEALRIQETGAVFVN